MRCVLALQVCVALAQALCLAPFQHVHADHDHDAVIHSHFFFAGEHQHAHPQSDGPLFDDIDDHATAKSLDTFTLSLAPAMAPLVLPRGEVLGPALVPLPEPLEAVEACAHDPPLRSRSNPRAPPA